MSRGRHANGANTHKTSLKKMLIIAPFIPLCLTCLLSESTPVHASVRHFTPANQQQSQEVSRNHHRDSADDGSSWALPSSSQVDANNLTKKMRNPATDPPLDFDPRHATGDTGDAYAQGQCTWWAYVRRHQLNKPVGSYFGNGAQWASNARRLGYWVDGTPRYAGDIIVFYAGQRINDWNADGTCGHVAIVEGIHGNTITISEAGSGFGGTVHYETISNAHDGAYQYIHM